MFEDSLLESAHLIRRQSRWPAIASVALQVSIAAALLAIPLVHPEALPLHLTKLEYTAPPPKPPEPPPVPRVRVEIPNSSSPSVPVMENISQPSQHARLERGFDFNHPSDLPPDGAGNGSMTPMGGNDPLSSIVPSGTMPRVSVTPSRPSGPLNISTGVSAGLLLAPIQPSYPPIAKAAHMEGTVIIHAIISKDGHIESANAVSGPVMLQGSALEAVRAARYRPYLLNGKPTEVDTTFSIVFRLNG